jgi:hypothetical protein
MISLAAIKFLLSEKNHSLCLLPKEIKVNKKPVVTLSVIVCANIKVNKNVNVFFNH